MSADTDLPETLAADLEAWRGAPGWVLAYSGGLDSTVLLHLLRSACVDNGPPLRALHVNHGLQPEAAGWAEHCAAQCEALGVPLQVASVAVEARGLGLEAAAREARYRAFESGLAPGECLFMAHHLDDQVETFLLRLMRGAGLDGLVGMPVSRPLGSGSLVRPLLSIERGVLEAYAGAHGLAWIEDPSNADSRLDRNFLRQDILPLLASRWPAYRGNVARSLGLLERARAQLQDLAVIEHRSSALGDPGMALAPLLAQDLPGAMLGVRAWLRQCGLPMPDAAMLEEFVRQLQQAGPDASPRLDCGRYRLGRYRDGIYCLPGGDEPTGEYSLRPGQDLEVEGVGRLRLLPAEGSGFSLESDESLRLAFGGEGLHLRPVGRGGSQSLKKLAQEAGVPPWWRPRLPLLYAGETLLAVGDLWLCESPRLATAGDQGRARYRLDWERNTTAP